METLSRLEVCFHGMRVGTIAPYQRYLTAFEYSDEWLRNGFSISPFSLPLQPGVKIAKATPFNGLFGIFEDSLPDGWGRLLVDRMLRKQGEDPEKVDALSRLSIVGESGMGGLEYIPVCQWHSDVAMKDYDYLANECRRILSAEESEDLDTLFALGGSSGGESPKVMINVDGEEWIIKFPSSLDPDDIGLMEYDYHQCAKECGIEVPETRLFESSNCEGYFGTRRFDRMVTSNGQKKIHMASASALLETSHRIPALDYTTLMALTWQLTKEASQLQKMFTLMCFNVFAHNRDDHSNNFSFIYDNGKWKLSPAYDLTYSNSMGGQHATTIAGEGKNPTLKNILEVAKRAGLKEKTAHDIIQQVRETVEHRLSKYLQ